MKKLCITLLLLTFVLAISAQNNPNILRGDQIITGILIVRGDTLYFLPDSSVVFTPDSVWFDIPITGNHGLGNDSTFENVYVHDTLFLNANKTAYLINNGSVTSIYNNKKVIQSYQSFQNYWYNPTNSSQFMYNGIGGFNIIHDIITLGSAPGSDFVGIRQSAGGFENVMAVYSPQNDVLWAMDTTGVVTFNGKYNYLETDSIRVNGNAAVAGYIEADSVVLLNTTYADFVFYDDYYLPPLKEQIRYARKHKHLQHMPERDSLVNAINYINALERKVEELYLYSYQLKKKQNTMVVVLATTMLLVIAVGFVSLKQSSKPKSHFL